jgi:hypothetical protein
MLNRDIYQKDPSTRKLVNEGVASVNDEKTNQALSVLRYELETFVCDGQYEKGLEHILDVYLKNIEQAEQPAVWVSGFYLSQAQAAMLERPNSPPFGSAASMARANRTWSRCCGPSGSTARLTTALPRGVSRTCHKA